MGGVKIDVFTRVRPASASELASSSHSQAVAIGAETGAISLVGDGGPRNDTEEYTFDGVFGPNATQAEVYAGSMVVTTVTISSLLILNHNRSDRYSYITGPNCRTSDHWTVLCSFCLRTNWRR